MNPGQQEDPYTLNDLAGTTRTKPILNFCDDERAEMKLLTGNILLLTTGLSSRADPVP